MNIANQHSSKNGFEPNAVPEFHHILLQGLSPVGVV